MVVALAVLRAASAAAAQPPGDAAANLAGNGKLEAALALLDTWLADHPDDPRMFPVLLQVVTAAPRQPTVDAVVERYRSRLAADQIAVLRAAPADLAELSGGVVQALRALELPGIRDASERRAALLLELGEVTLDTVPEGMPIVHAGLARSGEGLGQAQLEPSLRAAFDGSGTQADGGAAGAVAGYGLVSLLAANGRGAEAAAILDEMRRRYPQSPEYALAAAELNAGGACREWWRFRRRRCCWALSSPPACRRARRRPPCCWPVRRGRISPRPWRLRFPRSSWWPRRRPRGRRRRRGAGSAAARPAVVVTAPPAEPAAVVVSPGPKPSLRRRWS